jgi:dTDP-4-amino-4,6-dideoxygalactose transaminase
MTGQYISCQPPFPTPALLRAARGAGVSPFSEGRTSYWFRGSTALAAALSCLGLRPGETILFPSYHCGIELDVLLKAGLSIKFYDVDSDLRVDLRDIARLAVPGVRAVYLIHYLGFPGPAAEVAAWCRERGLLLLEDCAQALYSRERSGAGLGEAGAAAIFSLRKTLGMPCGGALVINAAHQPPQKPARRPALIGTLKGTVRLMLLELESRGKGWRILEKRRNAAAVQEVDPFDLRAGRSLARPIEFQQSQRDTSISRISKWIFDRTPQDQIVRRRRAHYAFLLNALKGARSVAPLVPWLPNGVCPLLFTVVVDGPRQEFVEFCRARGIAADPHWPYVHPAFPATEFPAAVHLKRQVVALPVHQSLTSAHLEHIGRTLVEWESARETSRPTGRRPASAVC